MNFSSHIIYWYNLNKRDLPWRNTKDPYPIWLSEILLQQTRVAQGLPYFHTFLENYPSLIALSKASEEHVFRLWEGLGYYNRARNLLKTAKILAQNPYPHFPNTPEALMQLPGIGPYTAAAIAAFAFDYPSPAIDGNAIRVITRYLAIDQPPQKARGMEQVKLGLDKLFNPKQAALFNQALMDFGATMCTPKKPQCHLCPIASSCQAFALKSPEAFPKKLPKKPKKERHFTFLMLIYRQKVLLQQRSEKDIWAGLWQFPILSDSFLTDAKTLATEALSLKGKLVKTLQLQPHLLSHQKIHANIQIWQLTEPPSLPGTWLPTNETSRLGMPRLLTRFLENEQWQHLWLD